jgi:molecular chaperone GrpE
VAADNDPKEDSGEFEIESVGPGDAAPNASSATPFDSAKIASLEQELSKARNETLYLRADFDNYKKAAIKERSDLIKYGSERVILSIIDVLDNFERALQTELTPETMAVYREGIQLTAAQFKKSLASFGVGEMDCLGAPFDPNLHEALSSEESANTTPGHITRVFKKAYKLHDRIIRPAQVVVAREPSKGSTGDSNSTLSS